MKKNEKGQCTLHVEIEGRTRLLLHNPQMVDPNNDLAGRKAELTAKKNKKTEADIAELRWIDWLAGLYIGEDKKTVIIPNHMLEGLLVAAAKKRRLGERFKAGVFVDEHAPLLRGLQGADRVAYQDPDKLFATKEYISIVVGRIKNNRIMVTRPCFRKWACVFEVAYYPEVVNEGHIIQALLDGQYQCGLGDWRPRYGQYALVQPG